MRPLSTAAHRFITEAQSERRISVGIPAIDREMRGISPGHLAMIVGYSHSGKTLVMLNIIHHNRDRRIALFTPDEPAPLVLTKFASLVWGIEAAQLERAVAVGEPHAIRMLHQTVEEFPNLLIFDQPLTQRTLRQGYEEACEEWGEGGDLVVIDYMDLVQGPDSIGPKMDMVKAFCTEADVPVIGLHQTSRSAGTNGRPMRIDSGNFGGETWATYQLGVWRKKASIVTELAELQARSYQQDWVLDRISVLQHELRIHEFTLTVNLNKNKRPGGQLILEGVDFELMLDTGYLRQLDGDLPSQYLRNIPSPLRVVNGNGWEDRW